MKTLSIEELSSYTPEEFEKFLVECKKQPKQIAMLNHKSYPDSDYVVHYAYLYKHENSDLYYVVNMNTNKVTECSMSLEEIYNIYLHVPSFLDENQ